VVKLFIQKPEAAKELVSKILKSATEEVDNPDLRDRGFMYWRLLSTNATAARDVVLAEKPPISTDTDRMDRGTLDQLLLHTGTLGSIYHKNPEVLLFYTQTKTQQPDALSFRHLFEQPGVNRFPKVQR
jgi:vesicle coat complex subunit